MTPWEPEPREYRQPPIPWWPLAIGIAIVAALVLSLSVSIPYYAIAPGGAVAVEPLVHVEEGPSYTPKGQILLCTVSLKRTTIMEALQGWLDPTIDVVKEEQVVPREVGRKNLHQYNLELMDTSKQTALGVAFEQLGYDAIQSDGAQVNGIVPKSPAARVLHVGDIIDAIDGAPTKDRDAAVDTVKSRKPGDEVRLTFRRAGTSTEQDVTVTLAARPDDKTKGFLGVGMQTHAKFNIPKKVDLESERIGGPSAGLAFTLETLDVLTKGELTGGHVVAATGTIEPDGTVGEVGGVAQKTVSVKAAGAELFLVPRAELKEARKFAGKHLRVEPVRNLRDALRILASLGGNGLALDRSRPGI